MFDVLALQEELTVDTGKGLLGQVYDILDRDEAVHKEKPEYQRANPCFLACRDGVILSTSRPLTDREIDDFHRLGYELELQ